ncbi:MAG: DUF72 domain-containing protein [Gemmatimonadota bacterium]|nr:DUF72 domain-containing protein [Gemmatimonadota bacterium]
MTGDLFADLQLDEFARLAERLPEQVRFGTSSWNYPGWQGLVYHELRPSRTNSAALLEEYARFPLFRTVGVDSSFYTPPTPETLARYADGLPAGFPCVSKVWDRITVHTFSRLKDPKRAGERNPDFLNADLFLEAVYEPYERHFAEHAGPFVFEFQTIGRNCGVDGEGFCELLDRFFAAIPRDGRYAVELRNDEFLTPGYFDVLRRHGVSHLFNSWTRMPPIGAQLDLPGVFTGRFVVARALLRPGRAYDEAVDAFAPYDRIQDPVPELRDDLLRLMREAMARDLPAYILVNNRAEGSAPLTIAAIARMWAAMTGRDV